MSIDEALSVIGQSTDSLQAILGLFDFTPGLYFYVKDRNGHFLWMNKPLLEHLGMAEVADCLGKEDTNFFSSDLVFLYHQEDGSVIESHNPLLNQPWLVPEYKGQPRWFLSSKIPLFDTNGTVVALAGIMWDLAHKLDISQPFDDMRVVIDHIFEHYSERIDIETLASLIYLSPRQFERRFRNLLYTSPTEFILKVRIDAATRLLVESKLSVTEIALRCGFYDNSHFTRQFKKKMNVSPIQFRKKFS